MVRKLNKHVEKEISTHLQIPALCFKEEQANIGIHFIAKISRNISFFVSAKKDAELIFAMV